MHFRLEVTRHKIDKFFNIIIFFNTFFEKSLKKDFSSKDYLNKQFTTDSTIICLYSFVKIIILN